MFVVVQDCHQIEPKKLPNPHRASIAHVQLNKELKLNNARCVHLYVCLSVCSPYGCLRFVIFIGVLTLWLQGGMNHYFVSCLEKCLLFYDHFVCINNVMSCIEGS